MSFDIALSGLNAVNEQLNTISNNIANTGTVGFKSSRVDFGTLYSETQAMGVEMLGRTQSITQGGSLTSTNRTLDLAISGGGFFVTRSGNGAINYTRAGVFGVDNDNYIVNNQGQRLQGFLVQNGEIQTGTLSDLRLRSANLPAQATDSVEFVANLDADMDVPSKAPFSPDDPETYNSTYTTKIHDSLGREHTLTQYFIKTADNQWQVNYYVDGRRVDDASGDAVTHALQFDMSGALAGASEQSDLSFQIGGGAEDIQIELSYRGTSQYGSPFAVTANRASGYAAGEQSGLTVAEDGKVYATYSNGQRLLQGQVVLANFANAEGLQNINGTAWAETVASGGPLLGVPGVGQFGGINSGALENSNVDLTQQLVQLMEGQRNYQANTKVLSTEKELTQILFSAI